MAHGFEVSPSYWTRLSLIILPRISYRDTNIETDGQVDVNVTLGV